MTDDFNTSVQLQAISKDQYHVFLWAGEQQLAEETFSWNPRATEYISALGALSNAALTRVAPEKDAHIWLGQQLYDTIFRRTVQTAWQERRAAAQRTPVPLRLRIDPHARDLVRLPWEYLHDGEEFVSLQRLTPFSRLPLGVTQSQLGPVTEPLRMLVQFAAPSDLEAGMILNTGREEELILQATASARQTGWLSLEFVKSGRLEDLEEAIEAFDPHILHFTGHGVFSGEQDQGFLLMEDAQGKKKLEPNMAFAGSIRKTLNSLRMVFLSACQSAEPSRQDGYRDLAPRLLEVGIPAVAAMQYSVADRAATDLGGAFYKAVIDGQPLDQAMRAGRGQVARTSPNRVDFAAPVLYLADAHCLQIDREAVQAPATNTPLDLSGLVPAQHFIGRMNKLRTLQSNLDPQKGTWRAAIIHGLGGIGKTALAVRLAERLAPRMAGVVSLRMTPTTTAQDVLDKIAEMVRQLYLGQNKPGAVKAFLAYVSGDQPLEEKVGLLTQVLRQVPLLVILDNYEDVLPAAAAVSRGQQQLGDAPELDQGLDPDLPRLVAEVVNTVPGPSRLLITSRYDFEPVTDEAEAVRVRAVGHVDLSEFEFREAVYLMETLPPLDELPVAVFKDGEGKLAQAVATKREIFEKLGGYPYSLLLFAHQAQRQDVQTVLANLPDHQQELLRFTLLEQAVAALRPAAYRLVRQASVLREAVQEEALAYMVGDEEDYMPEVVDEAAELLDWGLLAHQPRTEGYVFHRLVRDWAAGVWTEEERAALHRRAGAYWQAVGRDSTAIDPELAAHAYLYAAGDFEAAYQIVDDLIPLLNRWGAYRLGLDLLHKSLETTAGRTKAGVLHNLGVFHQDQGRYEEAVRQYEESLEIFEELGDRGGIASTLHQLGMVHQAQGRVEEAVRHYEESLEIKEELGNRSGIASTLHQLGMVHQAQGRVEEAVRHYEESLEIKEELGDRGGIASTLHQLGMVHQAQGRVEEAVRHYQESLEIFEELGDRGGIAITLHQLGMVHQAQGRVEEAVRHYEESLEIEKELGDRGGIASTLHQLGMVHQAQGRIEEAVRHYEESLEIEKELGDRGGIASTLHQLGMVHQAQGRVEEAVRHYEESLEIFEELGDRGGIASTLHQLGMVHQAQGRIEEAVRQYEESLEIEKELGDRGGIASTLHQLGMVHQAQGRIEEAVRHYEESLEIKEELGNRSGIAITLHQLGMVHQAQGRIEEAVRHYEESLEIEKEMGDRGGIAITLHQLGNMAYSQGRYEEAVRHYQESLAIEKELGNWSGIAITLHQLGMVHQAQGRVEEAVRHYEESLEIKEELGNRSGIAITLAQLGVLYQAQQYFDLAVVSLAQALLIFIDLQSPYAHQAIKDLSKLWVEMGETAFRIALEKPHFPAEVQAQIAALVAEAQEPEREEGERMSEADFRQALVANTFAVLADVPEQKESWWQALGQLVGQAKQVGDAALAAHADLLRQLVEGRSLACLLEQVPPDYRADWEALQQVLEEYQKGNIDE